MGATAEKFKEMRSTLIERLLETTPENYGTWQQLDVSGSDSHATYELQQVAVYYDMPDTQGQLYDSIPADFFWAEGHFQERVAGTAPNPGNWHDQWPYHAGQVDLHQKDKKYDHNYMERFWPTHVTSEYSESGNFYGYRFPVGDLLDVVVQLQNNLGTRQAYLPIFFPEDTGATKGQRVPCTLGYHFMVRNGKLHMSYFMRSCEAYRHFTNDVYMAVRLAQWVRDRLGTPLELGQLHMSISSFHGFVGDTEKLEAMV